MDKSNVDCGNKFLSLPPAITDADIAVVIDRHMAVVQDYAEFVGVDDVGSINGLLAAAQTFVSQYKNKFSHYYNSSRMLDLARALIDRLPTDDWTNVSGYSAGFVAWCLFECTKECKGTLPEYYLDNMRNKFRSLANIMLDTPWNFAQDSRVNCEVIQSAGLAVAGWALEDKNLLQVSQERMSTVIKQCCDENFVPSEISLTYLPQMIVWASLATEVAEMPDHINLIRGISSIAALFINTSTLEPMGLDCRETWKAVDRYALDAWLLALKIAAVVCNDGVCEWLARSIFRRWQFNAMPNSATYSSRAPRYLGCESLGIGMGPADSREMIMSRVIYTCGILSSLRSWNQKRIIPQIPKRLQGYKSSKLSIIQQVQGEDTITIGNIQSPVCYFTDHFCLHGYDMWSDDQAFWMLGCEFLPRYETQGMVSFRQRLGPVDEHSNAKSGNFIDRLVKVIDDQVILFIRINHSANMPPGIDAFGGMLLSYDKTGHIWYGRNGYIQQGIFTDAEYSCDWILYPSGSKRYFGFGLLHFTTSSNGRKLCNIGGDWCALEFRFTEEAIPGLKANALLIIGPWESSPQEYYAWLSKWTINVEKNEITLKSPNGTQYLLSMCVDE